jgi:hypothetical protein
MKANATKKMNDTALVKQNCQTTILTRVIMQMASVMVKEPISNIKVLKAK